MKTVSSKIENIFAHAVALEQNGRLKNTIHLNSETVFVLNSDQTVLLFFPLSNTDLKLEGSVDFRASDYDSNQFEVEDGKIIFFQNNGDMERRKICQTPGMAFKEVDDMYEEYTKLMDSTPVIASITLSEQIQPLLEESLSHLEFSSEKGQLVIRQRDIYSGTIIELTRKAAKGFGIVQADKIKKDFGPVGMRTSDVLALFSFNKTVEFTFFEGLGFCEILGPNYKMGGIVSLCAYDEMGEVSISLSNTNKEEDNGRQEQKKRRNEQGADRPAEEQQTQRKRVRK